MLRIKIALLATLISGLVLIIFGLFFLHLIRVVSLERIDREILALGESQLHVRHPKEHWDNFGESLRYIYGQDRWQDLIVQITDVENRTLYQSPHWPNGISAGLFPDFDHTMEAIRDRLAPKESGATKFHPDMPGPPFNRPGRGRTVDADEEGRPGPPPPPFHGRPDRPPPVPVHIKQPVFKTIETSSISRRTGIMGNQHITILIGIDMAGFYQDANKFQNAFLIIVPIALILLAAGGWWIAHRALKPVELITRTAEGITAKGLDQRIPSTGGDDEIKRLIHVINDMLDRLEKSFGQAARFSADAAHELQTPLTILQGVLDDAVQQAPSGSDEQRRYGGLLEEVQRLKVIVQKLLILARADAGQLMLHFEPVDISAMVDTIIEDTDAVAPQLRIEQQVQPGIIVHADKDLLQQVLQNLASNAMKYNIDGGLIRFQLLISHHKVLFKISNTGSPITEKDRERIFERFYRIDTSRSNKVPGTGLGLSLAREIVHGHNGDLRLDVSEGQPITFVLSLPCTP